MRHQIDILGKANELLLEENDRRGGRSKADILEEALIFYLEDMGTIEANIKESIASQMDVLCRLKTEKAVQKHVPTEPPTRVEGWIEERRQRMAREDVDK